MTEIKNKNSLLISGLTKKILAHNFDSAQNLIDNGIPFSSQVISQILSKNDLESFKFVMKNNINVSVHNIYDIFTEFHSNSDKFKTFIISEKFKNPKLENLFKNKEQYISILNHSLNYLNEHLEEVNVLKKENNFLYDLIFPMKDVLSIKETIDSWDTKISGFYQLTDFLPKISSEEALQLLEAKNRIKESKEVYSSYILERLNLAETLSPLIERRDELNKKIENLIETFQKTAPSLKIK